MLTCKTLNKLEIRVDRNIPSVATIIAQISTQTQIEPPLVLTSILQTQNCIVDPMDEGIGREKEMKIRLGLGEFWCVFFFFVNQNE